MEKTQLLWVLLIAGIKCKTFQGINHLNHSTQIKSKLFLLKDALTNTNNDPSFICGKYIRIDLSHLIFLHRNFVLSLVTD